MNYQKCLFILLSVLKLVRMEENGWQDDHVFRICPKQCVCQYAHFMDLSIARWIQEINKIPTFSSPQTNLVNDNEAMFEGDESFEMNPLVKFAMCITLEDHHPKKLLTAIPHDVQALVILHSGRGINITLTTRDFSSLPELITLEIRGPDDRSFHLVIDESMPFLHYVNFESINLIGSELLKRPKNPTHPSESFDYVPDSEKDIIEKVNISTGLSQDDEILPYEVYLIEMQRSRMLSFYGWHNLAVLRIHNCKLDELHWEMFNGLDNLQHLSLERNEIKIIPPFAFYGALHIKTLSLAYNHILDLNYRALAGLLDLRVLNLSHNNMSKLSELTFPPFPNLQYVDFRDNPIQRIFPATFGVMNYTISMSLGSKIVSLELVKYSFDSLVMLKHLTIVNASANLLDEGVFKGLKSIEILKVQGNISKIDFDTFFGMNRLKQLNLSRCALNKISMDAFVGCSSLEIVDLSHNKISYIARGLFDNKPMLKEVYLHNNRLQFLPSNFFDNLSLKLVQLNDNPWNCSCDMAGTWKSDLTNKIRTRKIRKCAHDFHSGKKISCRIIDHYKYDNSVEPKCANSRNQSIYYVIRKILRCSIRKILHKQRLQNKYNQTFSNELKNKHYIRERKHRAKYQPLDEPKETEKKRKFQREQNTIQFLSENNNIPDYNGRYDNYPPYMDQHEYFNRI